MKNTKAIIALVVILTLAIAAEYVEIQVFDIGINILPTMIFVWVLSFPVAILATLITKRMRHKSPQRLK
jgi:hypothetical protein